MEQYGLALHPDKTRLVPFAMPPRDQRGGKGPGTFDFLGFTVSWRTKRKGGWRPGFETRRERVRRTVESVAEYCRRHRHEPVKTQHTALSRRIVGHLNYFGVNGNADALTRVVQAARRLWHKWLSRRSAAANVVGAIQSAARKTAATFAQDQGADLGVISSSHEQRKSRMVEISTLSRIW